MKANQLDLSALMDDLGILCVALRDVVDANRVSILKSAGQPKGPEDYVTPLDLEINSMLKRNLIAILPCSTCVSEEDGGTLAAPNDYIHSIMNAIDPTWVIDPIDGSQNVDAGLFIFGSCFVLLVENIPVLAAMVDFAIGEFLIVSDIGPELLVRHSAGYGYPVTSNYHPEDESVSRSGGPYVSLLRGSRRTVIPATFMTVLELLHARCGRVFQTRAPTIDLFMLLRGTVCAVVGVELSGFETTAILYISRCFGFDRSGYGSATSLDHLPTLVILSRRRDYDIVSGLLNPSGPCVKQ